MASEQTYKAFEDLYIACLAKKITPEQWAEKTEELLEKALGRGERGA